MSSATILLLMSALSLAAQVPFVTKRVSLHNPIAIDFSGWRPLERAPDDLAAAETDLRPQDNHFLTVPVAVETDADHVLSEAELNRIREHVISNWKQKPVKSESFPHVRPLVEQLLPKPEVEVIGSAPSSTEEEEYTFVRMDSKPGNASSEENLFHAYFASKDHIPPEGYIRLTKTEFKSVFKNAEILFV